MSRRDRQTDVDPFSSLSDAPTLADSDSGIFGTSAPGKHLRAKPLSIYSIWPDPMQPRRCVPAALRSKRVGPDDVQALLHRWLDATGIKLEHFFDPDPDFERPIYDGPLQQPLVDLIDLALSIRQEGLANPITVVQHVRYFQIESGERRWLAYHLLHLYTQDEEWSVIPARDVRQASLWRQAAENGARNDLNAIGKARQLALLLMDMHGLEHFQPLDAFENEQDFYAQVAGADDFRVPHGRSGLLLSVMGLKNPVQLRQYRSLLRVPAELWHYADDNNLTEGEIRKARRNPNSVTRVTEDRPTPSEDDPLGTAAFNQRSRKVRRLMNRVGKGGSLNKDDAQDALIEIQQMRLWLEGAEREISRFTEQE